MTEDTPESKAVDMTINLKLGDIVRVGPHKFKIVEGKQLFRGKDLIAEFKRFG